MNHKRLTGKNNSRYYKLTDQVQSQICAGIRAGAFPWVAAEAAGIPTPVFETWLALGQPFNRSKNWHRHPRCTPFWHAVRQAIAHARLTAEIAVLKKDPAAWLKCGPGKDSTSTPGWSSLIKPFVVQTGDAPINLLLSPEMTALFDSLLQVLAPWPEARAALIAALADAGASAATP
jgi:hypothetical protein